MRRDNFFIVQAVWVDLTKRTMNLQQGQDVGGSNLGGERGLRFSDSFDTRQFIAQTGRRIPHLPRFTMLSLA